MKIALLFLLLLVASAAAKGTVKARDNVKGTSKDVETVLYRLQTVRDCLDGTITRFYEPCHYNGWLKKSPGYSFLKGYINRVDYTIELVYAKLNPYSNDLYDIHANVTTERGSLKCRADVDFEREWFEFMAHNWSF